MLAILLQAECALFSTSFALIVSQNCLNCDEQIFLLLKRTAIQALNKSDKCAHIAQQRDRRQGRQRTYVCTIGGMYIHTCVCLHVCVCPVVPKGYFLVEHCQVPWRISAYFAFTFAEDKTRTELVNSELQ